MHIHEAMIDRTDGPMDWPINWLIIFPSELHAVLEPETNMLMIGERVMNPDHDPPIHLGWTYV